MYRSREWLYERIRRERRSDPTVSVRALVKTFTDSRLCAAIADRLTFKGTLIQTGTGLYRLKATQADAAGRP